MLQTRHWIVLVIATGALAWWFSARQRADVVTPLESGAELQNEYRLKALTIDGETPQQRPVQLPPFKNLLINGEFQPIQHTPQFPQIVCVSIRGTDFAGNFSFLCPIRKKRNGNYSFTGKVTTVEFQGTANLEFAVVDQATDKSEPPQFFVIHTLLFQTIPSDNSKSALSFPGQPRNES